MTSDVHTGPLQPAAPDAEHHAGPLPKAAHAHKRSWREDRWKRRQRRRFSEELLGWILVPVIIVGSVWAVRAGLAAFGTTPTALIDGIKTVVSGKS